MRILFVLIVLANLLLFGIGKSWFGLSPSEEGRDPAKTQQELNAGKIAIGH